MCAITSLIRVVNSGLFHLALSVFTCFCFMPDLLFRFAGDLNHKMLFVLRGTQLKEATLIVGKKGCREIGKWFPTKISN